MTTGGITRLLLTEGERESGCLLRGGGGTTTMRTTPLVGNGGPVNGLPRTSIRLAEQPVHTYVHAHPLGIGMTTGGGWIHKQLVSRAFNLAPADTTRPSIAPAIIPGRDLDFLSGKKYRLLLPRDFSGSDVMTHIHESAVSFLKFESMRSATNIDPRSLI